MLCIDKTCSQKFGVASNFESLNASVRSSYILLTVKTDEKIIVHFTSGTLRRFTHILSTNNFGTFFCLHKKSSKTFRKICF